MAAVSIDSGPVSATDRLREVPREKWHDLMLARRQFMEIRLNHDCRCLVEFVNDAAAMFSVLGFDSIETMIRDGYHLEPEEISVAVEWLRLNPPDQPISLDKAVTLGSSRGRPRKDEDNADVIRIKRNEHGGTSRKVILARLDRDGHEELAGKVRAKTMSANAAAIAAGFKKKLTDFERVLKLWPKLTTAERQHVRNMPL